MSARVDSAWAIRRMRPRDIDDVLAIKTTAYGYPWSERIFRDCLRVGYRAWVIGCPGLTVAGYMLATIAAGEAHVLNLCIDDCARGQRLGEQLLDTLVAQARSEQADTILLEVRPSNTSARRLYARYGFVHQGTRPNYYPGDPKREDALLLAYTVPA